MRVLSRSAILTFSERHHEALAQLSHWLAVASAANWRNTADLCSDFRHASFVGTYTVFNIRGNRFWLIAEIAFRAHVIYLRHILTHADYDRGRWKK